MDLGKGGGAARGASTPPARTGTRLPILPRKGSCGRAVAHLPRRQNPLPSMRWLRQGRGCPVGGRAARLHYCSLPASRPAACVCVNQRLFITNTGPPRGVYTCPHKVGYDVTLSLLIVYILTVPSPGCLQVRSALAKAKGWGSGDFTRTYSCVCVWWICACRVGGGRVLPRWIFHLF